MFGFPPSLIAGGVTTNVEITSDEYIGDLFTYLGSPAGPVEVTFVVDNADAAEIIISQNFHPSSTFQFTAINGGRIIGTGGSGGSGGNDNGASGTRGNSGSDGGHAIYSNTFNVNVNVDNGYLLGGGGGGGGGSYNDTGTGGTPGGGGGGGAGWGNAAGGAAGNPTGTPVAQAGTAGSQTAAGSGGAGGTSLTNDGGDGASYGFAGTHGQFASPKSAVFGPVSGNGGAGGDAGSAFRPAGAATITFNGVKGETTLRSENRVKGEVDGYLNIPPIDEVIGFHVGIGHPQRSYGWEFENNTGGTLQKTDTDSGSVDLTTAWYVGNAITAGDYFVRVSPTTEGGNWTNEPTGTPGDWFQLSALRQWLVIRSTASGYAQAIFEIRRDDETLPAASGLLSAGVEYEP